MFQRAAILAIAVCAACAASPLAAAETPDSRTAGLRGPEPAAVDPAAAAPALAMEPAPLAVPDARPRRYSLHRDYGETPDPTVLPPEFFLTSPPVAEPAAEAPTRDRWGHPIQSPPPDSPTLDSASSTSPSS
jgi:hypothetical protein